MPRGLVTLALVALVGLAGCGSGGGGGSAAPAAAPAPANFSPIGNYAPTASLTSGTCGTLTIGTVTISQIDATHWLWTEVNTVPAGGTMVCDPEKCTFAVALAINSTLVVSGITAVWTGTETYSVTITKTGMTGTVNIASTFRTPGGTFLSSCSGTYNVLGPKLTAKPIPAPFPDLISTAPAL